MNNFIQSIKNLSPGRLASIAAIVIFLISFFVYLATKLNTGDYAVLYTDLEMEDAKQIVQHLETANIKYRLTKNGTEILVPEEDVNKMRIDTADLAMASKGSNVGYEIFDNTDALGSTNFVQNVNLIRALEGELARTIRSVDHIKSARVHLVLPKREMFSREEQMPTASVVIKTDGGKLSLESIHSIQQLIAAAVPKLDVKNVSIVDSAGNLLTNNFEDEEAVTVANNEALRLEQERKMSLQVQNLLEKSVGEGKVRAQVNLDMDFDQIVTNEEIYDPDSQVVRSQATVTDNSTTDNVEQPVSVAQNIPNGDMVAAGTGSVSRKSRTEETVNYEISKVVRNKVKNSGTIKRLGVAVIVDGIYERNAEGKVVYRDRTPEEMEQIRSLVKSAVGFDAERGDMVEVANMKFASNQPEIEEVNEVLIMGFTKDELIRIAEGIGVAIVAILVILLVIRPLINNAFETNTANGEGRLLGDNAEEDNLLLSNFLNEEDGEIDELINMNKIDGRIKVSSLKKINDIVEKNPDAAVNIIRGWLYSSDGN
ncbi:MAG: flagellar M-ring protein FliF [Azospirillum sp.]|uniref:flagellar basal-body MS-ring/collar protein FliF n=1 Tax=Candidatus Scatocola faecigallinarum TaxID=2840916 RepID=UPI0003365295|nr:flagellar M-ring protein FliF [Azospirillum sp.]CDB53088.1 flagellar FliF M-ring protein [Azospirillum sp. CAG:239]